jgi:NAD(P)-dependent dehydrogenase (short-subunit alcohol dehydrogenase family)
VVVGRTPDKCVRTVEEIQAFGGKAIALACDVSKRDQVDEVVKQTIEAFGAIHILVNNAHASRPMVPFEETTDKDMAVSMKGLYGTWYFMQACFPHLKQGRGKVINLGSVSGLRADAGFAAYAIAKEGIRAMSGVHWA